jgi:hypothetical protein
MIPSLRICGNTGDESPVTDVYGTNLRRDNQTRDRAADKGQDSSIPPERTFYQPDQLSGPTV